MEWGINLLHNALRCVTTSFHPNLILRTKHQTQCFFDVIVNLVSYEWVEWKWQTLSSVCGKEDMESCSIWLMSEFILNGEDRSYYNCNKSQKQLFIVEFSIFYDLCYWWMLSGMWIILFIILYFYTLVSGLLSFRPNESVIICSCCHMFHNFQLNSKAFSTRIPETCILSVFVTNVLRFEYTF